MYFLLTDGKNSKSSPVAGPFTFSKGEKQKPKKYVSKNEEYSLLLTFSDKKHFS